MNGAARAALVLCVAAARLAAQADLPQGRAPVSSEADAAIAQGRLDDAERLLFAAASRAPRQASVRGALGSFLASRGRLKVGAVLLEEARQFGGDAAVIDARLARIDSWLGDWGAVAALTHFAGPGVELDRARWLAAHPPSHSGPDSVSVPLEPNELAGLGRIAIVIEGVPVKVDIDPNASGLVLPAWPALAGGPQLFGMRDSSTLGAVPELAIGAMRFTNVPVRFAAGAQPAIGLDVLASLFPSFDAESQRLTLHANAPAPSGEPLPLLLGFPGVRFVVRAGQAPVSIESAAGRAALRGSRWTLDVRKGAIEIVP